MRYIFIGIRPKPFIRTIIAGHFLILIPYFFKVIPLWTVPAFVFVGHLLYALSTVGVVRIDNGSDQVRIIVRKLFRTTMLQAPLQYAMWWSYIFESAHQLTDWEKTGTWGNDLNVYLAVTDASGQRIIFKEYIGFDTRFPNECKHLSTGVASGPNVFRIQRTDHLLAFLQKHVTMLELQGDIVI